MCCAKSIAAGLPLGAVVGKAEIMDAPGPGQLGGTFSGNPVACAAGVATLDFYVSQDLGARARHINRYVLERLGRLQTRHPGVGDVRALGAMIGVEFVKDPVSREPDPESVKRIARECFSRGLIVLTAGILGTVPRMGGAETRRAIAAAEAALPAWRRKTAQERSAILRRWFDLILANQEDLAVLMTAEQGKPLAESRDEIGYAASFIEWFAEEGKRIYGDTIPSCVAGQRIVVLKEPIGVVAAITPWNFPSAMITRKAGPALAAGCTMVLKPASATPLSALALAELGERAGIPAGVFNVVTGAAGAIGRELTSNPVVRKLTFTGSTEIGKQLLEQCAGTVKKVSLELGGNAPFIVFEDADLDAAVAREETFGPVAPLFRFHTEAEAIRLANDTPYGLACYFYTRDLARTWRVAEALEYGIVGINAGLVSAAVAPFGGVKESGLGREGSKYGIEEFLEVKYLCIGIV
jgi:acyl-CoA reductase-like NAD-dependent aldehyde dehydrogenase